jgi:class 3 adenylate cyclase
MGGMAGGSVERGILMTDLESSTAHLRALGDDYGSVLARDHDIIRQAVATEGGREVGSEGDSFAVVFATTAAAVRAGIRIRSGPGRTTLTHGTLPRRDHLAVVARSTGRAFWTPSAGD